MTVRAFRAAFVAMAIAFLAGCVESPITVRLDFPTLDYVRLSTTAEVLVFDAGSGSRCADLVLMATESGVGSEPDHATARRSICDMRDGAAGIDELRDGSYDFLGVTYAADGKAIVAGCTHARWEHGRSPIVVEVASPSDEAISRLSSLPPSTCVGLDDYCAGSCP